MSSSPQVLDEAEIEFLLAQSAVEQEEPECESESEDPSEDAVTMRGDLDRINLADIFQMLSMSKTEGMLRLHDPLEIRRVLCKDGKARLLVPSRVVHRRIGQRLVQAGLVTTQQLRTALMSQRKKGGQLGQTLVEAGVLTSADLQLVLHEQATEDMCTVFTWQHGTFEFFEGPIESKGLQKQFDGCAEFEVSSLLLEVARRDDEWTSILGAIGTLDEVPEVAGDAIPDGLNLAADSLIREVDGTTTYRELADRTPHTLFDVAHAARDLAHAEHIVPISDENMIALAAERVANEEPKQAIMLLQTLRDRPGARGVEVVRSLADLLASCGERRSAGLALLEQAQQQTDPDEALAMAREACQHAPRDAETLSFLRTVLLAYSPADSEELGRCTLDLLDALIEERRFEIALEIVEEARTTETTDLEIRMREVRIRQRQRDQSGAIAVLDEIAEDLREAGDKGQLLTIYEAILKLDRSRDDVRKLLARCQRSRVARIVRAAVALVTVAILAVMGVAFWIEARHEARLQEANEEIAALLAGGDRASARDRLTDWAAKLGPGEQIDELRVQIDVADSEELRRLVELARKRHEKRLTDAGEAMRAGDLATLFRIHREVRQVPEIRADADKLLAERIDMALNAIARSAAAISPYLPEEADPLIERPMIEATLQRFREIYPPELRKVKSALESCVADEQLPEYLSKATGQRAHEILDRSRGIFARVESLSTTYVAILERQREQREFDPVFKEALERERNHDFSGALKLFRRLAKLESAVPGLRKEFRERVEQNEDICEKLAAIANATKDGDYQTARSGLEALEGGYPDIPFHGLVRLPVLVTTRPAGATIVCDGSVVGVTPLTLAYVPAHETRLALELEGFRHIEIEIPAKHQGILGRVLVLEPSWTRRHGAVIDAVPTVDNRGRTYVVDRAGVVTAFDDLTKDPIWTYDSEDLSGLLGRVTLRADQVVFPSLDGTLRVLDRSSGSLVWSLPDIPTDATPVLHGQSLLLATIDNRLVRVDLGTREVSSAPLPDASGAHLTIADETLYAATRSAVTAFALPGLQPRWTQEQPKAGERYLAVTGSALIALDDSGLIRCLEVADGTQRWRRKVPGLLAATPILGEGTLFVVSGDAALRLAVTNGAIESDVTLRAFGPIGRPVCTGDRILVRTGTQQILVLDRKTADVLHGLQDGGRGTAILPLRGGALVVRPDREVRYYARLP